MDRARLDRPFVVDGNVDAATTLVYRAAWWRGARTTREAAPAKRKLPGPVQRAIDAAVQRPLGGRPLRNDREGAHA